MKLTAAIKLDWIFLQFSFVPCLDHKWLTALVVGLNLLISSVKFRTKTTVFHCFTFIFQAQRKDHKLEMYGLLLLVV